MEAERTTPSLIMMAALAAVVVLAGCAPGPPAGRETVSGEPSAGEQHWTCIPLNPEAAERVAGPAGSWMLEGGSMLSVHRTEGAGDDSLGLPTRDGADADALALAAAAALDLLKQRGVSYAEEKRRSIIEDIVDSAARGAEIAFPRMSVVARSWDACVATDDGTAPADTFWRASVLVEYPIGLLRGDVNNVLWERNRAANEADVLVMSSDEHLSAGRWHDGLLDAARAADVVAATGVPLSRAWDASPAGDGNGGASIDDRLREALQWSLATAEVATSLYARPVGSVDVLETGAAAGVTVQFLCIYEWKGRIVPAVGVPVRFEMPGASAVLEAEPLTDGSGAAACRIVAAYGPPGEYELTVSVDEEATLAALSWAARAAPGRNEEGAVRLRPPVPLAGHKVHLVTGAHAISVCATFGNKDDSEAGRVADGFARRMRRDGFRAGECDPDVDVVITGEFSLSVRHGAGFWVAEVALTASAFDQRRASGLGATRVIATQAAEAEAGEAGKQEARALALKEAGRLLAVYFGPRILASAG